eukprot:225848-Alexandrium_andersonii.AAC.1
MRSCTRRSFHDSAVAGRSRRKWAPRSSCARCSFTTNSRCTRALRAFSATASGPTHGWLTCALKLHRSAHGVPPRG